MFRLFGLGFVGVVVLYIVCASLLCCFASWVVVRGGLVDFVVVLLVLFVLLVTCW